MTEFIKYWPEAPVWRAVAASRTIRVEAAKVAPTTATARAAAIPLQSKTYFCKADDFLKHKSHQINYSSLILSEDKNKYA